MDPEIKAIATEITRIARKPTSTDLRAEVQAHRIVLGVLLASSAYKVEQATGKPTFQVVNELSAICQEAIREDDFPHPADLNRENYRQAVVEEVDLIFRALTGLADPNGSNN